jgi:hypothetical protein
MLLSSTDTRAPLSTRLQVLSEASKLATGWEVLLGLVISTLIRSIWPVCRQFLLFADDTVQLETALGEHLIFPGYCWGVRGAVHQLLLAHFRDRPECESVGLGNYRILLGSLYGPVVDPYGGLTRLRRYPKMLMAIIDDPKCSLNYCPCGPHADRECANSW